MINNNSIDPETGEIYDSRSSDLTSLLVDYANDSRKKLNELEAEKEKNNAKKSPFNKWAQLNLDKTPELMALNLKNPVAYTMLNFMILAMGKNNACMIPYDVFMKLTKKSRPTIFRAIRDLERSGLVQIRKHGTNNVYAINHNFFWKGYGKDTALSAFDATVVITLDEQADEIKDMVRDQLETVVTNSVGLVKDED
ncbi:helix-turn-helix transcriptional regulator [Streptococcus suis]|nr:helix-turn-helix domain-containing protein [Streptococcus suis]